MRWSSRYILFFLFLLIPAGCGDDSDPTEPTPDPLDGVTLSTNSAASLGMVRLQGLPAKKDGVTYVVHLLLDEGGPLVIQIDQDAEGPFIRAPFHPTLPNEGGAIRLQVSDGNSHGPDLHLEVAALPEAPGAFAGLVDAIRAHIEQRAVWAGTSFSALQDMTFDATPPELLSLKIAQSYLESGDGNTDLASLVANEDEFLNATERELLDRMFAFAPLDKILLDEIDNFDQLGLKMLPPVGGGKTSDACTNAGPDISTAQQLSDAMFVGAISDAATNPDSPAGQTLSKLGLVLSVGGVIPGHGAAFSVAGAGLAAYQAAGQFLAGVYPSSLTHLDYSVDRTEFPEDETGSAQWSQVMVTAASSGWTADSALGNMALSVLGPFLSAPQIIQISNSAFLGDVAVTGVNMGLGEYLSAREGGFIEFCPQQWVVDITDLPFSTAQVMNRRFTVDLASRQILPLEVGSDIFRVAAQPSMFAGREIHSDVALTINTIIVNVSSDVYAVQTPGETVNITAAIQHAETESMSWETQKGSWEDGIGDETNGPATRPLKTPSSKEDYPFLVTVESSSRGGIRASGEPPRLDIVTIRHEKIEVFISPPGGCVENGEREQFTATVEGTDDQEVVWTLEDPDTGAPSAAGSITSAGNYKAPDSGSGTVVVVATSVAEDTAQGRNLVDYGPCECFWRLTINGEGSWSGDFASHDFGQFAPLFTMSFQYLDSPGSGGGFAQGLAGPGAGDTGDFPMYFTFISGNRAWAVGDDNEETEATLSVTNNSTDRMEGTLHGTAVTVINDQEVFRTFDLVFRSSSLLVDSVCGEE